MVHESQCEGRTTREPTGLWGHVSGACNPGVGRRELGRLPGGGNAEALGGVGRKGLLGRGQERSGFFKVSGGGRSRRLENRLGGPELQCYSNRPPSQAVQEAGRESPCLGSGLRREEGVQ